MTKKPSQDMKVWRREKVTKLRQKGCSVSEIASELALSVGMVNNIIHHLVSLGLISARPQGRKQLSAETKAWRREEVKKLRKAGKTNREIAKRLDLGTTTVGNVVTALLAEKQIGLRITKTKAVIPVRLRNLNDPLVTELIGLRRKRYTYEQIGERLGALTKERIRQLLEMIKQYHGDEVLEPQDGWLTLTQAAEYLSLSKEIIYYMCKRGMIDFERYSHCRQYLVSPKGVKQLQAYRANLKRGRECPVCGQSFFPAGGGAFTRRTCSTSCSKKLRALSKRKSNKKDPQKIKNIGWYKKLEELLQHHQPPKKEGWLTLREAVDLTGLSQMQVIHVGRKQLVSTKSHPYLIASRTKKPIRLYAKSELILAHVAYHQTTN